MQIKTTMSEIFTFSEIFLKNTVYETSLRVVSHIAFSVKLGILHNFSWNFLYFFAAFFFVKTMFDEHQ